MLLYRELLLRLFSTSYSSTDEDIYAAENAYRALEEALNTQINQMETTHPDYDEYRYQIDEIGHNPYQLISYLTVKYGGFTYEEVAERDQVHFPSAVWDYHRFYQRDGYGNQNRPGWRITGTGCYQWIL